MKKHSQLLLFALVTLLVLASPGAAFAAKAKSYTITARNQTSGVVDLSLTSATGEVSYTSIEGGVSKFTLPEGVYSYYASTNCGAMSGSANVNGNRTLYFSCENGIANLANVQMEHHLLDCFSIGLVDAPFTAISYKYIYRNTYYNINQTFHLFYSGWELFPNIFAGPPTRGCDNSTPHALLTVSYTP